MDGSGPKRYNTKPNCFISMRPVVVGFGPYAGHRLTTVPQSVIDELACRYPLDTGWQTEPDYNDLLITVAVHAETNRRKTGGKVEPHIPTSRELAEEIVAKGYQQASKRYHPDANGTHEAQILLSRAREELSEFCARLPALDLEDSVVIPGANADQYSGDITDDDVPF